MTVKAITFKEASDVAKTLKECPYYIVWCRETNNDPQKVTSCVAYKLAKSIAYEWYAVR